MPPTLSAANGLRDLNAPRRTIVLPNSREQGEELGGYIFWGEKQEGVEPGFVAKKRWADSDKEKLQTEGHKFHDEATAFLAKRSDAVASRSALPSPSLTLTSMPSRLPPKGAGRSIEAPHLSVQDAIENEELYEGLIEHLTTKFRKFQKPHYFKADYRIMGLDGRVRMGADRCSAKGRVGLAGWVARRLHNELTAKSRRDANFDVIRECLATDLLRVMGEGCGLACQKLKMVRSAYPDGTPKLLLHATQLESSDGEEQFEQVGKQGGGLVDGVLVESSPLGGEGANGRGGVLRSRKDLQIGRFKAFLLALCDYDAIGSHGQNKGWVGKRFAAIDCGKALPRRPRCGGSDLMTEHDVGSDLSLLRGGSAVHRMLGGYRNFSIFDDSPLHERMLGVQRLDELAKTREDLRVFDEYMEAFRTPGNRALDFAEDLRDTKGRYIIRRRIIIEACSKRLKFVERPAVLDFVDALECVTSSCRDHSPRGKVLLNYRRPIMRLAWEPDEYGDHYMFRAQTAVRVVRVQGQIKELFGGAVPEGSELRADGHHLTLTVPKENIDQRLFTEVPRVSPIP